MSILGHLKDFVSGRKKANNSEPPYLLKYRSSTAFILFTVCLAIFTDILYYGLIVPVIPFSITVQVGIPEDKVQQWTAILLACYNASLCIGAPIVGVYADHTSSRRVPLLIGLVALAGSTLLLCLGKSIAMLIIGRLLQGLSAAIVWSVGLALLADTMGRNIGYSMGYVSIAMSVGLLISPVIGGAVYSEVGYYPVYYIAFSVIFLDIVLRLALIEKKVARQWITDQPDVQEAPGICQPSEPDAALAPNATKEQHEEIGKMDVSGDTHIASEPSPVSPQSPDQGHADAKSSTRHPHLELIKSRRILGALFGVVIQAGVMFAFDTVVPLRVQAVFNWNSTGAGLVFICIMIPGFASPWAGILADRYGARWPSFAGFICSVPLLVLLRFVDTNSIGDKVLLCALLALLGATLMVSNTPLMAEISYAIDDKEASHPGIWGEKGVYGIGYGLFTTAFALGGTVGSLMAGYIVAGPGWGTMTWALAIWSAAGAFVVPFAVGGKPNSKPIEEV